MDLELGYIDMTSTTKHERDLTQLRHAIRCDMTSLLLGSLTLHLKGEGYTESLYGVRLATPDVGRTTVRSELGDAVNKSISLTPEVENAIAVLKAAANA